jgi:NADPH:quinone reductase-like Zn-dependent oxidoreductase
MRALTQTAFGPATQVLSIQHVDVPTPAPGELLVRVRAAGIAKGNWLVTRGLPLIARPSYGLRRPAHTVAGLEFAGVVEATNAPDSDLSVGDEVFGQHPGAFAELVAVPPSAVARKPAHVSFAQAAATPISGIAALQAVRAASVAQGQRVLVVGASGGVGSFTVQIAKGLGAHVTGVASARNLERVRTLGADDVIDYTHEDIGARGTPYDAVIDIAGNRAVSALRRVLTPEGCLVIVGGSGGRWTMGFERTVGAMLLDRFVRHRIVGLLSEPNATDLTELAGLMESGTITPLVHAPVQLEAAAAAIERVGRGEVAGTLVVTP